MFNRIPWASRGLGWIASVGFAIARSHSSAPFLATIWTWELILTTNWMAWWRLGLSWARDRAASMPRIWEWVPVGFYVFFEIINNMLNFISQISNKSEPPGFSVNMKPFLHLQSCPVLSTLTLTGFFPQSYKIWCYINIPFFWEIAWSKCRM